MASSAQRSRKRTSSAKARGSAAKKNTKAKGKQYSAQESEIANEIVLIGVFALALLLFLCNFGVIGVVGDAISKVMFGIFGLLAYIVPVLVFVGIAFFVSNPGSWVARRKLAAGVVLFLLVGMLLELFSGKLTLMETYSVQELYALGAAERKGGGIIAGSLAYLFLRLLGMVGTVFLVLVLGIICAVVITEKSFVNGVRSGSRRVYETARTDAEIRRERNEQRREAAAVRRRELEEQRQAQRIERERLRQEEEIRREARSILEKEKSAQEKNAPGVMAALDLREASGKRSREDIHEITVEGIEKETVEVHNISPLGENPAVYAYSISENQQHTEPDGFRDDRTAFEQIHITGIQSAQEEPKEEFDIPSAREEAMAAGLEPLPQTEPVQTDTLYVQAADVYEDMTEIRPQKPAEPLEKLQTERQSEPLTELQKEPLTEKYSSRPAEQSVRPERPKAVMPREMKPQTATEATAVGQQLLREQRQTTKPAERPYQFPPISLLQKLDNKNAGASARELRETAARLQQTLQTFGVRVTITDISQGPAVTRYELQPEQGVKVSKILGLSDDIKLNLAATDIRIEAPIPGKAAVGIEVPNKENTAVGLRELLETKEFKEFPSKLAFAVGKDIGGKVVVSDIAKMPHMLIAGATGSGKSVCINTLIMSILYKADPADVKLIMIDPKVVELSVYNGIPHLLIPVVTDPKKASAALQWGVAEMTDRYKRFADFNVRDLKGYNKKVEQMAESNEADVPKKMPQIVIIVDELADLMMVSPGEVEESICRLAQLARAAGIHLIIATQRPSVDVITGLIKANMPSRVAFSVSSGVDSRTILDMNGAEKLLGKGDMLFYPQGYTKPVRVQGAFVSDNEVSEVVDFLKNQAIGNVYSADIEEQIKSMGGGSGGKDSGGAEYDAYFTDAGKFIIDKDKASIGMLQRVFKIGFNRAARIMDQLAEAGVVGDEEGTKPRKVLMTMDEFEQLVEEII